jgi:hypothetical protein
LACIGGPRDLAGVGSFGRQGQQAYGGLASATEQAAERTSAKRECDSKWDDKARTQLQLVFLGL